MAKTTEFLLTEFLSTDVGRHQSGTLAMQQQRLTYLKDSYAAAYISAITTECTVFCHSCNGRIQFVVVVEYTVDVQQMTSTAYTGGVTLCWDGG